MEREADMIDTIARRSTTGALLAALVVALSACATEPESYPLSGEPCDPDDPVRSVEISECMPAQ